MQWYEYPRIDNFGQRDPQGPYWKPDSNILTPPGYPVTALLAGQVTSVQRTGWGQTVVTIKLARPLNRLATHIFYEHMHSSTVHVGQRVAAGDLIGHANLTGEGANLGFGLYSGDIYGSGPAWATLQDDLRPGGAGLLNPVPLLNAAKYGTLSSRDGLTSTGTSSSSSGGVSAAAASLTRQLAPSEDVSTFLWALDQSLELRNPFAIQNVQQDSIAGLTFSDPVSWLSQFGQNVYDDVAALTIRLTLMLIGGFIMFKVVGTFIDFGALVDTATSTAETVGKAAVLLA